MIGSHPKLKRFDTRGVPARYYCSSEHYQHIDFETFSLCWIIFQACLIWRLLIRFSLFYELLIHCFAGQSCHQITSRSSSPWKGTFAKTHFRFYEKARKLCLNYLIRWLIHGCCKQLSDYLIEYQMRRQCLSFSYNSLFHMICVHQIGFLAQGCNIKPAAPAGQLYVQDKVRVTTITQHVRIGLISNLRARFFV